MNHNRLKLVVGMILAIGSIVAVPTGLWLAVFFDVSLMAVFASTVTLFLTFVVGLLLIGLSKL